MTTRETVRERAEALRRDGAPYVHAQVVLVERPASAKPGDEALVLGDGTLEGFVGGACVESTVRAQSLALLDSGDSLLLRISPVAEAPQPGKLTVTNPCLSGGTIEVFLKPVMPAPMVAVHGNTPIGRALAALAGALGYNSVMWPPAVVADVAAVVVASHGRDEEAVLEAALAAGVSYVGLVASHKRGETVVASLAVDPAERARVRTPAGLDLGARTAEEVALSILAEIVATRPRPTGRRMTADGSAVTPAAVDEAVDPVCGMKVASVEPSLHIDHGGTRWWFCGSGCLRAFAADPAAYGGIL